MSHEANEVRLDPANRPTTGNPTTGNPTTGNPTTGNPTTGNPTTGRPTTGPEPSRANWPGPSGLGGPGTEELPVPRGSLPSDPLGGSEGDGSGPGAWSEESEPAPEQAFWPHEPSTPDKTMGTEQAIRAEQAIDETAEKEPGEKGPGGNGDADGEAARQRDEYLDALRRLQAEFDNYRKRVQRQQREIVENANAALVKKLLPVLDTADLALAHGGGEDVKQVASALFDILSKEGLERIDPEGQPFDPSLHDAVAHEPVEGQGAPQMPEVSEVLRAGYLWKGQVLRPAMVKVRG
jgi:molecular chaperone GrpE